MSVKVNRVRKSFRWPVIFTFTNITLNTPGLVGLKLWGCIIKSTRSISIEFHEVSTKPAVINVFKAQTNTNYLRINKENRLYSFKLDRGEIILIFDPLHLVNKNLKFIDKNWVESLL